MIGRDPIGSVVEIDGSVVSLNLANSVRGYVVGHRDGLSAFEQPGDLIAIEGGSVTIVARLLKLAFAEPRDLARTDRPGETPALRQMRVQVIGSLCRDGTKLMFESRNTRLPVLGAQAFPLSADEAEALVQPSIDEHMRLLILGDDVRGIGLNISASIDSLLGRHLAVLGATGQGKTHFVAYIAQELARLPSSRIVIFDVNGEYATAFRKPADKKLIDRVLLTVLGPKPAIPTDKDEGANFRTMPYYALGRDGLMRLLIPSERAQAPSLRFAIEHLAWVETKGEGARPAGAQALESLFDDCRSQGGPAAGTALETIRTKRTQAA